MRVTEPQLRTLLLAQAIEQADTRHTLVSPVELQDATRSAVAAARARGLPRVGVAEVMLERATTIADHASGRDTTVAALHAPHTEGPGAGGLGPWVARGLPLAALLLGLAIDRISNAHRVDLLSPPLLTVLAWNLAIYLLIAWRAWRPPSQPSAWLQQALRPLSYPFGRAEQGRGLVARIAADFHQRWWAHAADLLQQRAARVLHLCAAAWGAGIALSLLLRGLVVRYQFGWESTFLDATQVHAIVSVLFAPLTLLLGLAPFTLEEIAATQNFAGESGVAGMAGGGGAAGSRWVGMYVGLLLLAVVLPRLALAAWARWREHRWQGHIDPQGAAFDTLRASLPGDLVIGLHGPQAQAQVLLGASLQTPQGDRLQWVVDASAPVDAVLAWTTDPLPPAWQAAPTWCCAGKTLAPAGCWSPRCSTGSAQPCPPTTMPSTACAPPGWSATSSVLGRPCWRWRSTCAPVPHSPACRQTMPPHAMPSGCMRWTPRCAPCMASPPRQPPPRASGTPGPAAHRTTSPRWHGPGPGHLGRSCCGRRRRGQGGRADRPGHGRPDPGRRHGPGRAAGRHHGLGGAIAAKEGHRAAGPAATRHRSGLQPLPRHRPPAAHATGRCPPLDRALARRGHRHGGRPRHRTDRRPAGRRRR